MVLLTGKCDRCGDVVDLPKNTLTTIDGEDFCENCCNDDEGTEVQICVECGRSVAWGSGQFVNRVPVGDDYLEKKTNGYAFPSGSFMCVDCDNCEGYECEKPCSFRQPLPEAKGV